MQMNYSSGWIHEGDTVNLFDREGKAAVTYTICSSIEKSFDFEDKTDGTEAVSMADVSATKNSFVVKMKNSSLTYKISGKTVSLIRAKGGAKAVGIPGTVKNGGISYKVTAIAFFFYLAIDEQMAMIS